MLPCNTMLDALVFGKLAAQTVMLVVDKAKAEFPSEAMKHLPTSVLKAVWP